MESKWNLVLYYRRLVSCEYSSTVAATVVARVSNYLDRFGRIQNTNISEGK